MSTFPLEAQIRERGTEKEWNGGGKRLIKDGRLECQMCERENKKERGREREREMRRLIFGCDLKQLFLCGALKMDPRSFPLHPATLFMLPVYCLQRDRDLLLPWREKDNQFDLAINHSGKESCFAKECSHVIVSFCFHFAKTLTEAGALLCVFLR